MKKSIKIITALLLSFIGFQSQSFAGGAGGFGIKGGLAISTIGSGNEDFSEARNRFRLGGTGGFSYEVATPGTFAFEVDVLYDLRGTRQKFDNGLGVGTVKDFVHYINVPLSMKFYIGDVFNVHFGGYAGVAVAGTRNLSAEVLGNTVTEKTNLFDDDGQGNPFLNRIDGGLHFGAEFVSTKGIGVGSRAYIGLADITNDKFNNGLVNGSGNARTAEVSVYAIFRIGANK